MADDSPPASESRALATTEPRQRRAVTPVQDAIPLFDTAEFEHMGRIAAVMAGAKLVPACLQGSASDCLMVVNQARRWALDPFAVAQCASIVHGRLMWEGKLIAGVIESKLKLKLDFHFTGEKGKDDYRVYVSDKAFTDEIIGKLRPGASYRGWRIIDGSVGEWKTWNKERTKVNEAWLSQPDMQLRYRGARTWCRAYEPALMLGIYTPDEFEQLREDFEIVRVEVLPGAGLSSGFADDPAPKAQGRAPAASDAPGSKGSAEAGKATSASTAEAGDGKAAGESFDPETGEVLDDLPPGGAKPDEDKGAAEAEAEGAQDAEFEEVDPGRAPDDEDVEETTAPPGEPYWIFGEALVDGRVQLYRDGEPFSTVTPKGATKLQAYDHHAPKAAPEEEREPEGESQSRPSSEGSPAPEVLKMAPALVDALRKVGEAPHWLAIKQIMRTVQGSDDWKAADQLAADRVRGSAFARYEQLVADGTEKTPIPSDLFLFGLWMEFGAKAAAEIDGLFASLMRSPDWPKMTDAQKKGFGERMAAAKARLADG